jgi:hypothetical protein
MTEHQAQELRQRFEVNEAVEVQTLRSFAGEAGDIDDPLNREKWFSRNAGRRSHG